MSDGQVSLRKKMKAGSGETRKGGEMKNSSSSSLMIERRGRRGSRLESRGVEGRTSGRPSLVCASARLNIANRDSPNTTGLLYRACTALPLYRL